MYTIAMSDKDKCIPSQCQVKINVYYRNVRYSKLSLNLVYFNIHTFQGSPHDAVIKFKARGGKHHYLSFHICDTAAAD